MLKNYFLSVHLEYEELEKWKCDIFRRTFPLSGSSPEDNVGDNGSVVQPFSFTLQYQKRKKREFRQGFKETDKHSHS